MITFLYIIMIALTSFVFVYLTYEPKCKDTNSRYCSETPIDPNTHDDRSCEEEQSEPKVDEDIQSDVEEDIIEDESEIISEPEETSEPDIAVEKPTEEHVEVIETPAIKDTLSTIKGIGPKTEEKLNEMGITRFEQIAIWTQSDIDEVNKVLSFSGRVERDEWISQAITLSKSTTK